ncbi:hypothetical protein DZF93_15130 [Clavibacter michiganensis subsp. insidiosus]|uniref:Uncharacterized protein n=1 Tax=Clavibacter michiganensis subsp. insidiosus TaxID=33014 RepID=A0A399Q1C6_9MICO|nr:hypothetical protein B5P21_01925 [Clavibacter michiganensis subsp. insidiosus]RIJ12510.1 hypothetical protein DZF93_15130 [Clavibacter michiganensis subsp. insidiosus]
MTAERCLPAPLTVSPDTVAPGGTVTVSSAAVDCDLGYGSGRTHTTGIASEALAADGSSTFVEGEAFAVAADGSFRREVVVPAELPTGPAYVSIRGSAFDDGDDGESSCTAYVATLAVG